MNLKQLLKRKYRSIPGTVFWPGMLALLVIINYAFIPQIFGPEDTDFLIQRGDSLRVVASNLKSQDLIKSKTFFVMYGLILGKDKQLKAGHYEISSTTTHGILMEVTDKGGNNDIRVTIPEGFNTWEIDERLASIGVTSPGEILNFRSQEGWMFPDTYNFNKGDTPLTVINKMTNNFTEKTVELRRQAREEDIKTLEETLSQVVIEQRTPSRVLHRRADKLRKRRVRSLSANIVEEKELELKIRCEGGLYVKELIHGDHGRTNPSVSCILQTEANTITLDVLDIHFRG